MVVVGGRFAPWFSVMDVFRPRRALGLVLDGQIWTHLGSCKRPRDHWIPPRPLAWPSRHWFSLFAVPLFAPSHWFGYVRMATLLGGSAAGPVWSQRGESNRRKGHNHETMILCSFRPSPSLDGDCSPLPVVSCASHSSTEIS